MPELTFSLLGTPQLFCGAVPVSVDTRKAIALLAYLAIAHQPQARDTPAALPERWLSEAARLVPELDVARPGLPAAPPFDSPISSRGCAPWRSARARSLVCSS